MRTASNVAIFIVVCSTTAQAATYSLQGTFTGFFPSGSPYTVLTGSWSASVDDTTIGSSFTSVKVRPDSIIFDQAQTFEPVSGSPNFNTTWTAANTLVDIQFFNGAPTGVVTVGGDPLQTMATTFSAAGTGNNDFEMYYSDSFINLSAREPLGLFKYNLLTVGDYTAAPSVANTLVNGFVTLTQTVSITGSESGPIEFLGGTDANNRAGISIDFGGNNPLNVVVMPAPTIAQSDLFVFNTFSTQLQAWDIDVQGTLDGDSKIYIPYASSIDPAKLKIYHFDSVSSMWELLTTDIDSANRLLIAYTDTFSPFVQVYGLDQEQGQSLLSQLNADSTVPEPATLALFGLGLAGLGAVRRKKLAA